jgi:K+-sensing histidine kinase KdpD
MPTIATRYAIAAAASLFALLITTQLHSLLDSGSFMVFLTAVVVAAGYGGLGPGLVATVLSVALIDFFFLAPRFSLRLVARADVLLLAVYALVAVFTSYFGEWLRAARRKAEDQAQNAAAIARLFERHVADLERELDDVGSRERALLKPRPPDARRPMLDS